MGFGTSVKTVFSKYAVFSGRAARPEFWYFILFIFILNFITNICDAMFGTTFPGGRNGWFSGITSLLLIIPHAAVSVRRLHDTDRSGWWFGGFLLLVFAGLIALLVVKALGAILLAIALISLLALLFWFASPGTPGDNRYGPPRDMTVAPPEPVEG